MSDSPITAEPAEVVTLAEARELLAALDTLKRIVDRAATAAYTASSGVTYPRTVRAQDYGRLAGVAHAATDVLFGVVNVASNYTEQAGAAQAMTELSAAIAAETAAS